MTETTQFQKAADVADLLDVSGHDVGTRDLLDALASGGYKLELDPDGEARAAYLASLH